MIRTCRNRRTNELLIMMGDWNAIVGEQEEGTEVGKCSLGNRNERGEKNQT